MAVPFTVGSTVHELGEFNDRAAEVDRVRRAMRLGERLLIYGERRIGKSSIIERAAARVRVEQGAVVVHLDLWSLSTPADVLRGLLGAIPYHWATRVRLIEGLASVGFSTGMTTNPATGEPGISLGLDGRAMKETHARALIEETLKALDEIAARGTTPIVIVMDEFQQIGNIMASGAAWLRSQIQHAGHLSFVMAGSMLTLIDGLTSPKGPFYSVPRLEVGPIDMEIMAPWIEEQMRTNGLDAPVGLGQRIIERAGPSTEARVKLAREVFFLGSGGRDLNEVVVDEAVTQIVGSMTSAYEAIWGRLAEGQRRTLQMVANGEKQFTSASVLNAYGVTTSSTVIRSLEALRNQALLSAHDPVRIADPYFAEWIRSHTAPPSSQSEP